LDRRKILPNLPVLTVPLRQPTECLLGERLQVFVDCSAREEGKPRAQDATSTLAVGGERPDELRRSIAWGLLIVLVVEAYIASRTYA
jgi:hypothetical protein